MSYYTTVILAEPSLVSYWRMNETTGTTMVDSKGLHHGFYVGGVTLNRTGFALLGPSVLFDGYTSYAEVPSAIAFHTTVPPFNNAYSIESWVFQVFPEAPAILPPWGTFRSPWLAGVDGLKYSAAEGGVVRSSDTGGLANLFVAQNINTYGAWHHVVETWTGLVLSVYVDGVLVFSEALPDGWNVDGLHLASSPFVIGGFGVDSYNGLIPNGNSGIPYLFGFISNVAYYFAALTPAQVLTHYNAAFLTGPVPLSASASSSIVFTPTAANVPVIQHGQTLVTQVAAEVVRRQSDGFARVTQVAIEVVRPYVAGSVNTFDATATASIVFTPTAAAHRNFTAAGTASIVFAARGNAFHGLYKAASASIVFTAVATLNASSRGSVGHVTIIFRARAKNKFLPIVFGDDYLGRFQLGQEVPLWDLVRDQHGQAALPTTEPPEARVYNLDTRRFVETVSLTRLRGSRNDSVYTRLLPLGAIYTTGRHAVTYRAPSGGFIGYNMAIFEVVAGGDVSGPALATHTFTAPGGDQVMAQLGSGALAKGSRPRVT